MIRTEREGDVTLVTIDRHERRNALDIDHCQALATTLDGAAAAGVRVVVVTGAGSSFCAGADLGAVHGDGFRHALRHALRTITRLPIPVITAVNGPAVGAGTQVAVDTWTVRRPARFEGR